MHEWGTASQPASQPAGRRHRCHAWAASSSSSPVQLIQPPQPLTHSLTQDVAKYLRNLDPNSAYYDPKTRAMRENPLPGANPEEVVYAGDNYLRCASGCGVQVVVLCLPS